MIKKIKLFSKSRKRISDFLKRRPHRSFRLTRRRDYKRALSLPGYFAFNHYVFKTLKEHKKTFLLLAIFSAVITALLVGIMSQDSYKTISDTLDTTTEGFFTGGWGQIGKASLLFLSSVTGGLSSSLTELQQALYVVIILFTWLISVWLLRNLLAGHKVKLRDGLYSAGSPVIATFIAAMVLLVQLLPFALALIAYGAASTTGLLDSGIEAMLFWFAAGLLTLLSVYWITSTIFALVIVTLPGMYPFKAIKISGDLVVGRRLRIMLRLIWMIVSTLLVWAVILIPIIMFDAWVKGVWSAVSGIPTVPIVVLLLSSLTTIWVSSYVYLLYRRIVANDAEQA